VPKKLFGKEKSKLITESNGYAKVIKAPDRNALLIGAAHVKNKAAVIAQFAIDQLGKLRQPVDILMLVFVTVFLLAL
jgi:hypothetical protein